MSIYFFSKDQTYEQEQTEHLAMIMLVIDYDTVTRLWLMNRARERWTPRGGQMGRSEERNTTTPFTLNVLLIYFLHQEAEFSISCQGIK